MGQNVRNLLFGLRDRTLHSVKTRSAVQNMMGINVGYSFRIGDARAPHDYLVLRLPRVIHPSSLTQYNGLWKHFAVLDIDQRLFSASAYTQSHQSESAYSGI